MNYLKMLLFNFYFYIFFFAYSAVVIPFSTLFVAFLSIFIKRRRLMVRVRRSISWWGRGITLIPFPFIRIMYEDHSVEDLGEPYIFVCNHRSASDGFLMALLPHEVVQVVNLWPFKIPVLGFFAKKAGYLNIRDMKSEEFFEAADRLLGEKVSIVFFPEGTRSVVRDMGEFHGAAFRLALKSKVPIVPLCISGSDNILKKGSALMMPGTIRVRRLPAIRWNDYKKMNAFSLKNKVRDTIGNELSLMEQQA